MNGYRPPQKNAAFRFWNESSMNIAVLRKSIRSAAVPDFSRSGGPGGQNVNKVNTKVTLRLPLAALEGFQGLKSLTETELTRVKNLLANRINAADEIIISSDEERSQRINLERAYMRLEALVTAAARLPKRRRPTKPSLAAREQRLQSKQLHSRKKAMRRQRPSD
jgi:ribosome-associated protein